MTVVLVGDIHCSELQIAVEVVMAVLTSTIFVHMFHLIFPLCTLSDSKKINMLYSHFVRVAFLLCLSSFLSHFEVMASARIVVFCGSYSCYRRFLIFLVF